MHVQVTGIDSPRVTREAPIADGQAQESGLEMTVVLGLEESNSSMNTAEQAEGLMGFGEDQEENDAAAEIALRYPAGNSSAACAMVNLVNTIVGAGIIGLPFALAQSGLWAGSLMMFLAAFLCSSCSNMLIAVGEKSGRLNYEELMMDVFGNAGLHTFGLFVGVLSFGAMAAYLIIVGDTFPRVMLASGFTTGALTDRNSVIVLFGVFGMLPVSLLKDLSKLSYVSFVSIMADVLLTLIVLFAGPSEAREQDDIDRSEVLAFIRPTVFAGFGVMSFAFGGQTASFLVYRSMAKRGERRWAWVSRWSLSIALGFGLVLGLGGYFSFGDKTQGNILNNFSADHRAASVARGLLAVTMLFTYPMAMYIGRHVIDFSVFQTLLAKGPTTSARHYGITVGMWALTMVVSVSTDDLGFVLEVFGAFGSSALNYILPALLYIYSNQRELRAATDVWRKGSVEYAPALGERLRAMRKFFVPMFAVFFGVVAMVTGVVTSIVTRLEQKKT